VKPGKSNSGLPFLATVVLLIVVFLLIFVSHTCVSVATGDTETQKPAEEPDHNKKIDIVFFKELQILLGAIILVIALVFILLILRHKRII